MELGDYISMALLYVVNPPIRCVLHHTCTRAMLSHGSDVAPVDMTDTHEWYEYKHS